MPLPLNNETKFNGMNKRKVSSFLPTDTATPRCPLGGETALRFDQIYGNSVGSTRLCNQQSLPADNKMAKRSRSSMVDFIWFDEFFRCTHRWKAREWNGIGSEGLLLSRLLLLLLSSLLLLLRFDWIRSWQVLECCEIYSTTSKFSISIMLSALRRIKRTLKNERKIHIMEIERRKRRNEKGVRTFVFYGQIDQKRK